MGISKIFLLFCLIVVPIFAAVPTSVPTGQPTDQPTSQPSIPTGEPTNQPTSQPSIPTSIPSSKPSRVYDYYSPDTELDLGVKSATLRASANDVGVPLTLNITFRLTRDWYENEIILIDLPRFTRTITYTRVGRDISDDNTHDVGVLGRVHVGANVSFGGIMVSPSNRFQAAWVSYQ